MFICGPCHQNRYGGTGIHSESRGTCDDCLKTTKCVDCSGHSPRRIVATPVQTVPPIRRSPAIAALAGRSAAPSADVSAFCDHCRARITMAKGTGYWLHARTQVKECGP